MCSQAGRITCERDEAKLVRVPGVAAGSFSSHCFSPQMALPTLPSYWCTRRLLDQQMARQRQREQEARLRQQWDQNSRYFRMSDLCSSKQAEWSSKTSYQRR